MVIYIDDKKTAPSYLPLMNLAPHLLRLWARRHAVKLSSGKRYGSSDIDRAVSNLSQDPMLILFSLLEGSAIT